MPPGRQLRFLRRCGGHLEDGLLSPSPRPELLSRPSHCTSCAGRTSPSVQWPPSATISGCVAPGLRDALFLSAHRRPLPAVRSPTPCAGRVSWRGSTPPASLPTVCASASRRMGSPLEDETCSSARPSTSRRPCVVHCVRRCPTPRLPCHAGWRLLFMSVRSLFRFARRLPYLAGSGGGLWALPSPKGHAVLPCINIQTLNHSLPLRARVSGEMQRWIRQESAHFLRDSRAICTQGRLTARLPLCGTDLGGRQRISIALHRPSAASCLVCLFVLLV